RGAGAVDRALTEDIAASPAARCVRVGGPQGTGGVAVPMVGGRAADGASLDVIPPALVLVLLEAPLLAARQELPDPLDVERDLLASAARALLQEPGGREEGTDVADRYRKPRGKHEAFAVDEVDREARRRDEVAGHRPVESGRDASHRIRQVSVEPRKEPEPVLGRQGRSRIVGRLSHREAPGLSAETFVSLVDRDVEAALGELVG